MTAAPLRDRHEGLPLNTEPAAPGLLRFARNDDEGWAGCRLVLPPALVSPALPRPERPDIMPANEKNAPGTGRTPRATRIKPQTTCLQGGPHVR